MAKLPALPFVRSSVSRGLSANHAYRDYRVTAGEQGLRGMRRQDFLRLYSETRDARDTTAQAMDAPKNVIPSGDLITRRTTEYATGYGTFVNIYQRTRGQDDLIHTPYLIKSREPITPAQAEQRALWYLEQEEPEVYDRVTLGVSYAGTNLFVPRER